MDIYYRDSEEDLWKARVTDDKHSCDFDCEPPTQTEHQDYGKCDTFVLIVQVFILMTFSRVTLSFIKVPNHTSLLAC